MKLNSFARIRLMPLGAVIACCALPLHCSRPIEVAWSEVCKVARGLQLIVILPAA